MKRKLISFLASVSMVAGVSCGFATSVSANNVSDQNVIEVAESVAYSLTYSSSESSELTRVFYINCSGIKELSAALIRVSCDDTNIASVDSVFTGLTGEPAKVRDGKGDVSFSITNPNGADFSSDKTICKLTLTLKEDKAMTFGLKQVRLTNSEGTMLVNTSDANELSSTIVNVDKFTPDVPTVTPITVDGTRVVRHTDGKDRPAEYWVAELDPAGTAFNTITVEATDSVDANKKATGTKTSKNDGELPILTGESTISVHIAILNADDAVGSVKVTASYVE